MMLVVLLQLRVKLHTMQWLLLWWHSHALMIMFQKGDNIHRIVPYTTHYCHFCPIAVKSANMVWRWVVYECTISNHDIPLGEYFHSTTSVVTKYCIVNGEYRIVTLVTHITLILLLLKVHCSIANEVLLTENAGVTSTKKVLLAFAI